ncbi:AbfB domain-containing protein [Actinoplanes bogorensis]|uniref:AbfB domain-containing protein n=1 Tax=Paractinoplanes bogorensis TaxID=1610840 RepID=A0ABS5YZK3_9ACTN|nr:AbfB domain-containing protein [Actinoplanes bogorensis]MBU2668133.1 AbfB domain-containing protein [Actinoplanes bogorensis]
MAPIPRPRFLAVLAAALCALSTSVVGATPAQAAPIKTPPLTTPWTSQVNPANPLPEYPRPQMVRPDWQNLNGEWQLRQSATNDAPQFGVTLPERINVPYPVESALSGVMRPANDNRHYLFYRRTFTVPAGWNGRRIQLHFGAVDWESTVWVNGQQVATHRGGYDRFEADITPALNGGTNELVVKVWDPTDTEQNGMVQALGKQTTTPSGIFYTPSSGIWQTVWMEPTPTSSIYSVDYYPNLANNTLRVRVFTRGNVSGHSVFAEALNGTTVVGTATGGFTEFTVPVPSARRWSPSDPFLYNLRVSLRNASGATVDQTTHYFGMREVGTATINGVRRPTLNGQFVPHIGPLDQGFWPDGLYTAPTDAALASDLQKIKDLGFNMVRKHIKVEPARWYYWADRLGLLVWQDIPSMTADGNINANAAQQAQWETEAREIIDEHRFSPAVVLYTPYNEGWGETSLATTTRVGNELKAYDPTRYMNVHSGYNCCQSLGDPGNGDLLDHHHYTGPEAPRATSTRWSALGEFGGTSLQTPGNQYSPNGQFGAYEQVSSQTALTDRYVQLANSAAQLIRNGTLSATVYTEITDLEGEVNGFFTYDRRVTKMDLNRVRAAHQGMLAAAGQAPLPRVTLPVNGRISLQAQNVTSRYMRHQNSLVRTDPVTGSSDALTKNDATFWVRPGLADSSCYSLEAVNVPGNYLRHSDSRIRIGSGSDALFRADATWCARQGQTGSGVSLESYNYAGSYMRHYNAEVWRSQGSGGPAWNTPSLFPNDSVWNVVAPWAP